MYYSFAGCRGDLRGGGDKEVVILNDLFLIKIELSYARRGKGLSSA